MRNRFVFRPYDWDLLEARRLLSADQGAATVSQAGGPATVITARDSSDVTPIQRLDSYATQRYQDNIALANAGQSDVVFFGDSIADWFENGSGAAIWKREIAPFNAADFGEAADLTENLLWELQNGELNGHPKVAVVQIGTVDLYVNDTPQHTADAITAVVQQIEDLSPQTKILLMGIFPRGEGPGDPERGGTSGEISEVNSLISGLADGSHVQYLDIGPLFLRPDDTIPSDLLGDYVHPTEKGYQLWADALQGPLDELLGRPRPDPSSYGTPVLVDVPTDREIVTTDATGSLVSFPMPLAFDASDPHATVTCTPPSGSTFPIGTTAVTCTAIDRYGQSASASFKVTVRVGAPPTLLNVPADIVVEATGPLGTRVDFSPPQAVDPVDPSPTVTCSPSSGSTFPIGTTAVTCTAADHYGLSAGASFKVTVIPKVIIATVQELDRNAFAISAPKIRLHSHQLFTRRLRVPMLDYNPTDPRHNISDGEAAGFLSRVDANHDFRVTPKELTRYISSTVDLNRDGYISLYESTLFQLKDPQGYRFLFLRQ